MSKDFKDLINTVEKDNKSHAELEAEINSLKEEINRLNGILKEQKLLIDEHSDSIALDSDIMPGEVDILKDLVLSQRKESIRKDEIIEKLNDKIDELTFKIEKSRDESSTEKDNEDLIEAQELILAFSEENERYRNQIEELKSQIDSMNSDKGEPDVLNQEKSTESEDMVNIKRLNFQLMEENGLLRVEIESLKVQLQEQMNNFNREDFVLANQKIEALTAELNDYEAQVQYLQQKLETEVVTVESLTYTQEQLNNLKEELSFYQNENLRLNNMLLEFENDKKTHPSETGYQSVIFNFPNQFQISLFIKMYDLLIESDKKKVIDALIKELDNRNVDIKRVVLKILGEIRDDKVYDAFLKLLHDDDWVIRYNVIKNLTKSGFENQVFIDLLKNLRKDRDIDVRELASKVLEEIS